ncbi:Rfpl4b [Phodopus roborovskii]|uniref:Rfpl4b protein n=1 Tax=Phodopus roborovskii TaxID=109678 RepID=A0AAU9YU78_PHORO|nr:Rfpl4b [Phodopus roborovskii]
MWVPRDSLEEEALCPVCLDFNSSPVYLSCTHTFCIDCMENWMARKEGLILTCPLCREENKRPIIYECVMTELIILIKQHGLLLQQHMEQTTGLLGLFTEAAALEADTGDSSLVLSDDLRHRFIPSAMVLDSSHISLVCQEVPMWGKKEWTPAVCKEPVSRTIPGHNLMEDSR